MKSADLAKLLGLSCRGSGDVEILQVCSPAKPKSGHVLFIDDPKVSTEAFNICNCFILSEELLAGFGELIPEGAELIINDKGKESFIALLTAFDPYTKKNSYCDEKDIKRGEGVEIGPFSLFGKNVSLGDRVTLMGNNYIGKDVVIGKNTLLYPGVVIESGCVIGENVIIHANSVIGGDGFGYEKTTLGLQKIPQIGNVIIEDHVEIGNNVCVDRATLDSTIIGSHTKIDNLVQIAHNCNLGSHCIIISQSGIAGSCTLGEGVVLAGQAGLADHVTIGDGTIITAQSGITSNSNIEAGKVLGGSPAISHIENQKVIIASRKLPEILKELKQKGK